MVAKLGKRVEVNIAEANVCSANVANMLAFLMCAAVAFLVAQRVADANWQRIVIENLVEVAPSGEKKLAA